MFVAEKLRVIIHSIHFLLTNGKDTHPYSF